MQSSSKGERTQTVEQARQPPAEAGRGVCNETEWGGGGFFSSEHDAGDSERQGGYGHRQRLPRSAQVCRHRWLRLLAGVGVRLQQHI